MKLLFLFSVVFLSVLFSVASANAWWNITQFSDNTYAKNMTFDGLNQNQTIYVKVPKNATILSSYMNVSGYDNYGESDSNTGIGCGPSTLLSNKSVWIAQNFTAIVNNISRVGIMIGTQSGTYNVSIRESLTGVIITSGSATTTGVGNWGYVDLPYTNLTIGKNYYIIINASDWTPNPWWSISADCGSYYASTGNYLSISADSGTSWEQMYKGISFISIDFKTYTRYNSTNPYLDVAGNGDIDWNYTGNFNVTVGMNRTFDLSPDIMSYLATCSADANGLCTVPFRFHSDTAGFLQANDTNITYDYSKITPCGETGTGMPTTLVFNLLVSQS